MHDKKTMIVTATNVWICMKQSILFNDSLLTFWMRLNNTYKSSVHEALINVIYFDGHHVIA